MSVSEVARCLAATGFARRAINGQEGLYILSVDEGNLVEKHFVGNDVESENIVASDVREGCSTPYLFHEQSNMRIIYLIDQANTLQMYTFNDETLEWEQSPGFLQLAIQTSPQSQLAASITPGGETAICYQNTDGQLAGIVTQTIPASEDNNEGRKIGWLAIGPLTDATPKAGTPVRLEIFDEKLHLFYVHGETGGLRYVLLDPAVTKWEDHELGNSVFGNDTPIISFLVTKNSDKLLETYVHTAGGTIWNVLETGKDRKNLGEVNVEGDFKPANNAQSDTSDDDFDNFVLPRVAAYHMGVGGTDEMDEYGLGRNVSPSRWMKWVLKLKFVKEGAEKHGNGFLVNIPNQKYDIVLTAAHNLVEKANTYTTDLRIVFAEEEKSIDSSMIRVCQTYLDSPSENFAIYDYGVILLHRNVLNPRRGFGFGLMLGVASPPEGRLLYVSGYLPKDSGKGGEPRRSEGNCVQAGSSQLVYRADTEAGMSGGPVWLGFRGTETVVAIHNYGGGDEKNPRNKGTRINLEVWRTVSTWAEAMWTNKSLHYYPTTSSSSKSNATASSSPTYQMHLHMQMPSSMARSNNTYAGEIGSGRVRVGCPGRVETFFDILPIAARPMDGDSLVCYGFILTKYAVADEGEEEEAEGRVQTSPLTPPAVQINSLEASKEKTLWVHWNPASKLVSVAEYLDTHVEVRLQNVVRSPQTPFAMQVRVTNGWMQIKMGREDLIEADLEPLREDPEAYEDTSEVSFIKVAKEKLDKTFVRAPCNAVCAGKQQGGGDGQPAVEAARDRTGRRATAQAPRPGDGPLMERRADRELPDVGRTRFRWMRTLPWFVLMVAGSSVAIFNYQKSSSPVVSSTLYALRTSPRARALLGDEIYFRDRIPWIAGEMNQLQGRIDVQFMVRGTRSEARMRFTSRRPSSRAVFETLEWSLETADGRKIDLLQDVADGQDPFRGIQLLPDDYVDVAEELGWEGVRGAREGAASSVGAGVNPVVATTSDETRGFRQAVRK
ncbi:cytochrome c oxidase assembly protein [Grosmannia clavigera kw1407]|uniref:Cytochrome c oxidase assembly protein n=1 Tax=Grosmannia clavigera (strain kw1407 / UAMH 11150) TaxID=655863 RepID=F0XTT2_GROCL|nr:cytochrome c oxidase assembly protein [Grosmannia clavigera kw1407]EFW98790.1 cytochrome c oxidase assembly protein [Grosmannia clavigera kw1407]